MGNKSAMMNTDNRYVESMDFRWFCERADDNFNSPFLNIEKIQLITFHVNRF